MHKFIRCLFLLLTCLNLLPPVANAQSSFWSDIDEVEISANPDDRQIIPEQYRTVRLEFAPLQQFLQSAPEEIAYFQGNAGLTLDFPMPDGSAAKFEIWKVPVLHPDLQAKFPEIQSYAGKSTGQKGLLVRFEISPYGFHAMILNTPSGSVFIEPYARGNNFDYTCFYKKYTDKRNLGLFSCGVDTPEELPQPTNDRSAGDCGTRREYRLALACTGEYANYHGAFGTNKAPALAAMNTSMNRINGVYERDVSVRMIIVANNEDVIFTDPDTDPYINNTNGTMLNQNQSTCDAIIGSSNYDIGHVFCTAGGGIAQLNVPCNNSSKAKGATGLSNPIGDVFDIDYVSHEMGHQFGGNHTQYNDNCNRNNPTSMEPGSASTIMGYAGVCAPFVQFNSDDYFHAISLQEMGNFVTGSGNSCPTKVSTGNSAPSMPAISNRNIPNGTPFILSGSATDPNGDPLSFCWEQMNNRVGSTQPMPPESTNSNGPMFRTFQPQGTGVRYCPRFEDVLSGFDYDWEELPSIGRTMSWRLTARDNNPTGGCTTERNMTVTTSNSIGPFEVMVPNGGESYPSNSTQTITWDVAGSNNNPVNCANVSIMLSLDGGNTFNTLVASTPNDGSEDITFNAPVTNKARIMIQAVGNIFYDISDGNFSFSPPLPVELVAFQANARDRGVALNWETATEKNNRGFYVERSLENTTSFSTIGWVEGHGTVASRHTYEFFDAAVYAGAVYYYRLRQTDFDGKENFSEIRAVQLAGDVGGDLLIVPNPAETSIRVQLPFQAAELAGRVAVLDVSGALVLEQELSSAVSALDVSALARGLYFVQVFVENRVYRGSFLK